MGRAVKVRSGRGAARSNLSGRSPRIRRHGCPLSVEGFQTLRGSVGRGLPLPPLRSPRHGLAAVSQFRKADLEHSGSRPGALSTPAARTPDAGHEVLLAHPRQERPGRLGPLEQHVEFHGRRAGSAAAGRPGSARRRPHGAPLEAQPGRAKPRDTASTAPTKRDSRSAMPPTGSAENRLPISLPSGPRTSWPRRRKRSWWSLAPA